MGSRRAKEGCQCSFVEKKQVINVLSVGDVFPDLLSAEIDSSGVWSDIEPLIAGFSGIEKDLKCFI